MVSTLSNVNFWLGVKLYVFMYHYRVLVLHLNSLYCYTLTGLADENESVREAALGAGHVLVEHYAIT